MFQNRFCSIFCATEELVKVYFRIAYFDVQWTEQFIFILFFFQGTDPRTPHNKFAPSKLCCSLLSAHEWYVGIPIVTLRTSQLGLCYALAFSVPILQRAAVLALQALY